MSHSEDNKLVLFYASWCPHSKKFIDVVWKYFVNKYAQREDFVLKEADCSKGGTDVFDKYRIKKLESYPTLILFMKDQAFVYEDADRSIYAIEKFLESPMTYKNASPLIYSQEDNLFSFREELTTYRDQIPSD